MDFGHKQIKTKSHNVKSYDLDDKLTLGSLYPYISGVGKCLNKTPSFRKKLRIWY